MIVRVCLQGDHVIIENHDRSLSMTSTTTDVIRARMNGRTVAFFDAKVGRGGGKDRDGVEYLNPSTIVELGEVMPDPGW